MEIISFDITGKFAHFRKYYANNTALSYFIPPRTTIMGMIAALLGKEKDSYYEAMASDKIRIGVRVLCPLKKSFHRVNLLKILGTGDFRGKQGRVQTPFEVVSGLNIATDDVRYRIYVSCHEGGKVFFEEIKKVLHQEDFTYNLTFGTANFAASFFRFKIYDSTKIEVLEGDEDYIFINSAICSENANKIGFEKDRKLFVEEELLPSDFVGDGNRELAKMNRVIYSINEHPIPVIYKGTYYRLLGSKESENVTFIE
jgi:CRISPR-associated protein Cas5h